MTLAAQIAADVPVFLNTDEFARRIVLDNGEAVDCVVEGNGDTEGSPDILITQDVLLHAATSAFHDLPVVGQRLTLDDKQAQVIGVNEEQGVVELRLRWIDS